MKKNILILCTGNSCRSQMAHGFFEKYGKETLNVYSAGIETHGVNPMAVQFMSDVGIDISKNTSNHIEEYKDVKFDYIITVCDHARENCPWFPSDAKRFHYNFKDPSKIDGVNDKVIAAFEETRDAIDEYARKMVERDFVEV